jgi:hypothetical protein
LFKKKKTSTGHQQGPRVIRTTKHETLEQDG